MRINRVFLRHFRNYDSADFFCEESPIYLLGDNAQGKTNFLEALYYASTIRSFRTTDDLQLIQFRKEFAKIQISFERQNNKHDLMIVISGSGKYLTVDGQVIRKTSDVIGLLNVVVFSPADFKNMFGIPKDRRKFIDMELGKISPSYLNDLLSSQHLLKERNAHLKLTKTDDLFLEVITNQLVEVEVRLIQARARFLKLLEESAEQIYSDLTKESSPLRIRYDSCIEVDELESMKLHLQQLHLRNLVKDKELRITNAGTHREDFTLLSGDLELSSYGSQGQRRSAILALKFGLLQVIYRRIQDYPILLLDDVLSELDIFHRSQLFRVIPASVQVFVTATDINSTDRLAYKKGSYYQVTNGVVTKEEYQHGESH